MADESNVGFIAEILANLRIEHDDTSSIQTAQQLSDVIRQMMLPMSEMKNYTDRLFDVNKINNMTAAFERTNYPIQRVTTGMQQMNRQVEANVSTIERLRAAIANVTVQAKTLWNAIPQGLQNMQQLVPYATPMSSAFTGNWGGGGRGGGYGGGGGGNFYGGFNRGLMGYTAGMFAIYRMWGQVSPIIKDLDLLDASFYRISRGSMSAAEGMQVTAKAMADAQQIAQGYAARMSDVAGTMVELSRTGMDTESVTTLTAALAETRLLLATSTGQMRDLQQMAQGTIALKNQLRLGTFETTELIRQMAELDIKTATNFDKLSQSMLRFAASGRVARLTVDEMLMASTALTEAGFSGEMAGTALNTIFTRPDRTARETRFMAQWGVSATEIQDGTVKVNSSLEMLLKTYEKLNAMGQFSELKKFIELYAGTRQAPRFMAMLDMLSQRMNDYKAIMDDAKSGSELITDAREDAIKRMTDTIDARQTQLQNTMVQSFNTEQIKTLYKEVLTHTGSFTQSFVSLMNGMIEGVANTFTLFGTFGDVRTGFSRMLSLIEKGLQAYLMYKIPSTIYRGGQAMAASIERLGMTVAQKMDIVAGKVPMLDVMQGGVKIAEGQISALHRMTSEYEKEIKKFHVQTMTMFKSPLGKEIKFDPTKTDTAAAFQVSKQLPMTSLTRENLIGEVPPIIIPVEGELTLEKLNTAAAELALIEKLQKSSGLLTLDNATQKQLIDVAQKRFTEQIRAGSAIEQGRILDTAAAHEQNAALQRTAVLREQEIRDIQELTRNMQLVKEYTGVSDARLARYQQDDKTLPDIQAIRQQTEAGLKLLPETLQKEIASTSYQLDSIIAASGNKNKIDFSKCIQVQPTDWAQVLDNAAQGKINPAHIKAVFTKYYDEMNDAVQNMQQTIPLFDKKRFLDQNLMTDAEVAEFGRLHGAKLRQLMKQFNIEEMQKHNFRGRGGIEQRRNIVNAFDAIESQVSAARGGVAELKAVINEMDATGVMDISNAFQVLASTHAGISQLGIQLNGIQQFAHSGVAAQVNQQAQSIDGMAQRLVKILTLRPDFGNNVAPVMKQLMGVKDMYTNIGKEITDAGDNTEKLAAAGVKVQKVVEDTAPQLKDINKQITGMENSVKGFSGYFARGMTFLRNAVSNVSIILSAVSMISMLVKSIHTAWMKWGSIKPDLDAWRASYQIEQSELSKLQERIGNLNEDYRAFNAGLRESIVNLTNSLSDVALFPDPGTSNAQVTQYLRLFQELNKSSMGMNFITLLTTALKRGAQDFSDGLNVWSKESNTQKYFDTDEMKRSDNVQAVRNDVTRLVEALLTIDFSQASEQEWDKVLALLLRVDDATLQTMKQNDTLSGSLTDLQTIISKTSPVEATEQILKEIKEWRAVEGGGILDVEKVMNKFTDQLTGLYVADINVNQQKQLNDYMQRLREIADDDRISMTERGNIKTLLDNMTQYAQYSPKAVRIQAYLTPTEAQGTAVDASVRQLESSNVFRGLSDPMKKLMQEIRDFAASDSAIAKAFGNFEVFARSLSSAVESTERFNAAATEIGRTLAQEGGREKFQEAMLVDKSPIRDAAMIIANEIRKLEDPDALKLLIQGGLASPTMNQKEADQALAIWRQFITSYAGDIKITMDRLTSELIETPTMGSSTAPEPEPTATTISGMLDLIGNAYETINTAMMDESGERQKLTEEQVTMVQEAIQQLRALSPMIYAERTRIAAMTPGEEKLRDQINLLSMENRQQRLIRQLLALQRPRQTREAEDMLAIYRNQYDIIKEGIQLMYTSQRDSTGQLISAIDRTSSVEYWSDMKKAAERQSDRMRELLSLKPGERPSEVKYQTQIGRELRKLEATITEAEIKIQRAEIDAKVDAIREGMEQDRRTRGVSFRNETNMTKLADLFQDLDSELRMFGERIKDVSVVPLPFSQEDAIKQFDKDYMIGFADALRDLWAVVDPSIATDSYIAGFVSKLEAEISGLDKSDEKYAEKVQAAANKLYEAEFERARQIAAQQEAAAIMSSAGYVMQGASNQFNTAVNNFALAVESAITDIFGGNLEDTGQIPTKELWASLQRYAFDDSARSLPDRTAVSTIEQYATTQLLEWLQKWDESITSLDQSEEIDMVLQQQFVNAALSMEESADLMHVMAETLSKITGIPVVLTVPATQAAQVSEQIQTTAQQPTTITVTSPDVTIVSGDVQVDTATPVVIEDKSNAEQFLQRRMYRDTAGMEKDFYQEALDRFPDAVNALVDLVHSGQIESDYASSLLRNVISDLHLEFENIPDTLKELTTLFTNELAERQRTGVVPTPEVDTSGIIAAVEAGIAATQQGAADVVEATQQTARTYEQAIAQFVPLATTAQVTSVIGDDRDGGNRKHKGVDVWAPLGTPVHLPNFGAAQYQVTKVGYQEGGAGHYVELTGDINGEKILIKIMHLMEKVLLEQGTSVLKAGDYIGQVGRSGNVTAREGTGILHVETYLGDSTIPHDFRDIVIAGGEEFVQRLQEAAKIMQERMTTPVAQLGDSMLRDLQSVRDTYFEAIAKVPAVPEFNYDDIAEIKRLIETQVTQAAALTNQYKEGGVRGPQELDRIHTTLDSAMKTIHGLLNNLVDKTGSDELRNALMPVLNNIEGIMGEIKTESVSQTHALNDLKLVQSDRAIIRNMEMFMMNHNMELTGRNPLAVLPQIMAQSFSSDLARTREVIQNEIRDGKADSGRIANMLIAALDRQTDYLSLISDNTQNIMGISSGGLLPPTLNDIYNAAHSLEANRQALVDKIVREMVEGLDKSVSDEDLNRIRMAAEKTVDEMNKAALEGMMQAYEEFRQEMKSWWDEGWAIGEEYGLDWDKFKRMVIKRISAWLRDALFPIVHDAIHGGMSRLFGGLGASAEQMGAQAAENVSNIASQAAQTAQITDGNLTGQLQNVVDDLTAPDIGLGEQMVTTMQVNMMNVGTLNAAGGMMGGMEQMGMGALSPEAMAAQTSAANTMERAANTMWDASNGLSSAWDNLLPSAMDPTILGDAMDLSMTTMMDRMEAHWSRYPMMSDIQQYPFMMEQQLIDPQWRSYVPSMFDDLKNNANLLMSDMTEQGMTAWNDVLIKNVDNIFDQTASIFDTVGDTMAADMNSMYRAQQNMANNIQAATQSGADAASAAAQSAGQTAQTAGSKLATGLASLFTGILMGLIGMALGALFHNPIKDMAEQMAEAQRKAQRDRVTSSGFNWSYREAERATPYAEYSPPITHESVKIVKFNTQFTITTDAAMAMMSNRRELERVCTEILTQWLRTNMKTIGAQI